MRIASEPMDVGAGYSVEFTFDEAALHCEWSPTMPSPTEGKRLIPAYRQARDRFLATVATQIGVNVGVLEL